MAETDWCLNEDHIRELIDENTRQELRDESRDIEDEMEAWMGQYNVDAPDELLATIDDSTATADAKERNWAANHWRENQQYRVLFALALWRYDEWFDQ